MTERREGMKGFAAAAVTTATLLAVSLADTGSAAAEPDSHPLDRLVALVADRLDTADTVAAVKWAAAAREGTEPVIDDPARETRIYEAMARLGAERGLPEPWVRQVFAGQIEANKIVQRGLVERWRAGLAAAPVPTTDLAGVRPVIDRANVEIVEQLAAHRAELSAPGCATDLAESVLDTMPARNGDAVYRVALVRASFGLCATPS